MSDLHLVDVPVPGGTAQAHVSRPEGGTGTGVLLFMDAIGLRPQIAAMCDRIASWGHVVLAPNVFHREGDVASLAPTADLRDPEQRAAFMETAMGRVGRLTPDLARADIAAYVTALRRLDGVTGDRIGTTGYCMGARLAVYAAADHPDAVAACGGFHGGGLVTDDPQSPHRVLPSARAEFLFGHADRDRSMPPEAVATLGVVLNESGLTGHNEVFPDAPHGYTMADTSMYQELGAERHYRELQALLARTLGPGTDG